MKQPTSTAESLSLETQLLMRKDGGIKRDGEKTQGRGGGGGGMERRIGGDCMTKMRRGLQIESWSPDLLIKRHIITLIYLSIYCILAPRERTKISQHSDCPHAKIQMIDKNIGAKTMLLFVNMQIQHVTQTLLWLCGCFLMYENCFSRSFFFILLLFFDPSSV